MASELHTPMQPDAGVPQRKCATKLRRFLIILIVIIAGFFVYREFFPSQRTRALNRIRELGGYPNSSLQWTDPLQMVGLPRSMLLPRIPTGQTDVVAFVVEGKAVTDSDVELFCTAFPLVEQVDLSSTSVSAKGLVPLTKLPRLWRLLLRHTSTDDQFLASLSSSQIRHLDLSGTRVTDAGIATFLGSNSRIWHLHLAFTRVTDQTCVELAKHAPLGLVDLTATQVTASGVQQLQAAHPQCKIIWDGPMSMLNTE